MRYFLILIVVVLCGAVWVGAVRQEPTTMHEPADGGQDVSLSPDGSTKISDVDRNSSWEFQFFLSDAAREKVKAAMASVEGGTHLVVSVDVDDEKYCVGFHYSLSVEAGPSKSTYAFAESNGIQLAIEKDDIKFLNGTTLDYAEPSAGAPGFIFRNPNEKRSLPEELRE